MKNKILCGAIGFIPFLPIIQVQAQQIEHIKVVSGAFDVPLRQIATSVSVVDEDDIQARGYVSVADILRHEQSIAVSNSGGVGKNTTLRIRGEEGYRTQLYIDGVELVDPTAPQVTPIFDDVLSSQIERVEILRGPQGLVYGADAGGIVSISTYSGDKSITGGVKTEFGRYDTHSFSAHVGLGSDVGRVFLALTDFSTDGFNAQSSDLSQEADGYDNTTLHFKGALNFNQSWQAQLVIRDVEGENEFDGCFNASFSLTNDCFSESENTTGRLSFHYQSDQFEHEFGFSNTDAKRDNFSQGNLSFGSEGQVQKLNYIGQVKINSHQVLFGADFESEEIQSTGLERNQRGVFAEFQGSWFNNTFFTAAIRHDNNDTFGTFHSFRLSAAHILKIAENQSLKLKATYGTGFRAPSLFEQDFNDGPFAFGTAQGLQLSEEESKGFDLGLEWFIGDDFELSLTYFDQEITDEILFDPIGFQGYLQIDGTSDSKGLELSVEKDFSNRFNLWSNYTYNDTQTATGEDRIRRPRHLANLGASLSLLNETLSVSGFARLSRDAIDIGNQALDDYVIANVSINYNVNDSLSVSLRGENIFDREYQEVLGFNTAGASYYLGFNLQY